MTTDLDALPLRGEELIERFGRLAWQVIWRFSMSSYEAREDVWQATCEQVLLHAGSLREREAAGAWVAAIARNEALKHLRRESRYEPSGDMTGHDQPDPGPAPDERLLRAERAAEVRAAVATLPPRRQAMITMLMADEPATYTQVSAATGMPYGSIGPTRDRCLQRLRVILGEAAA